MEKQDALTVITNLQDPGLIAEWVVDQTEEAYDSGHDDGLEEALEPATPEENKHNIEFCLNELQEAKTNGVSIDDLIRDLTIRQCKYMEAIGLPLSILSQSSSQISKKQYPINL